MAQSAVSRSHSCSRSFTVTFAFPFLVFTCATHVINMERGDFSASFSGNLEGGFKEKLLKKGITQDSLSIMEEEGIVNKTILRALRREHIHKLLEVMKLRQHALLLEMLDYGPQVYL